MGMSNLFVILLCATSISVVAASKEFDPTRFTNFFPVHRGTFVSIRDGPCAQLYSRKLSGQHVCLDLLDCMLEHTRESVKGDLSSGVIALGLMPTILTFLGSSTAETGLLSKRRPVLALLIALGAPSVSPIQTFVYPDPIDSLEEHKGRLMPAHLGPKRAMLVSALQYILVLGAVANVYTVCFYTGSWTINTISCDTIWLPLLWAGISLPIHLLAMWSLSLCVFTPRGARGSSSFLTALLEWLSYEHTPCMNQRKLVLKRKPETLLFIMATWALSILTVVHTLYGTIAFSSVQFLGYVDSIQLIARLMASAIVCRAVLMFELAGMRNAAPKTSSEMIPLQDGIDHSN